MGISRGRSVTVTENSRNGGFDPSVVIRNAVVPNHWIFAVPPRSTTALLSSEPIRRASRRENMKMRIRYNDAVNLLVFSEQLGIPLMNSYVSMRLLPYFVGELEGWKRREMREREILEEAPEIH